MCSSKLKGQCDPIYGIFSHFQGYQDIYHLFTLFFFLSSETRSRLIPGPAAMPFQLQYARVNHCSAGRMHGVLGVIIPHALVSNFRGFATYKCTGWFEPMDMYGRKHLRKANRNI